MPEAIVLDQDPRLTSGFWCHVFELLVSKLPVSTADHPEPMARPKGSIVLWQMYCAQSQLPKNGENICHSWIFASNNTVHASTRETPFMLTNFAILGQRSRLCTSRVLVGEAHYARSECGRA